MRSGLQSLPLWKTAKADQFGLLIGSEAYYSTLQDALQKAKKRIIMIGWDIDSRISLKRNGPDDFGPSLKEVIKEKAQNHPDLDIYLLRWDYAPVFFKEREFPGLLPWVIDMPENVHAALDATSVSGGSHHQKIVIIDDVFAFIGGMDVALGRWDSLEHAMPDARRTDPFGEYGPYHDIQACVTGDILKPLIALAKMRWEHACGSEMPDIGNDKSPGDFDFIFDLDTVSSVMQDVECGLSRTLPEGYIEDHICEIEPTYIELINRAEKFIYLENQFLTRIEIATALNKRLKDKPDLRVLLVSSYDPKGLSEEAVMWAGRIEFMNVVKEGIDPDRIALVCSMTRQENNEPYTVRIHAKLCLIDDQYAVIGSANINNRSMMIDSECDLVIEANSDNQKETLADLRFTLIKQHSQIPDQDIHAILKQGASFDLLVNNSEHKDLHVVLPEDEKFVREELRDLGESLADPNEALIPNITPAKSRSGRLPWGWRLLIGVLIAAITALAFWQKDNLPALEDTLLSFIYDLYDRPVLLYAGFAAIYSIGCLFMIPVTLMITITGAVLGTMKGFIVAMLATLLTAALHYGLGYVLQNSILKNLMKNYLSKIQSKIEQGGLLGLTVIRMVPVAPFAVVNMTLGIFQVPFGRYMLGTLLGLLPGMAALVFLGGSIKAMLANPTPHDIVMLALALCTYGGVVFGLHILTSKFKQKAQKN